MGKRPYRCPHDGCNKSFGMKTVLTKHLKTRHENTTKRTCLQWRPLNEILSHKHGQQQPPEDDDEIEEDDELDLYDDDDRSSTSSSTTSTVHSLPTSPLMDHTNNVPTTPTTHFVWRYHYYPSPDTSCISSTPSTTRPLCNANQYSIPVSPY
jgi:hypothetical protein